MSNDIQRALGIHGVDVPKIVLTPIEHLVKYERNARTHSAKQVAEIQASMQKWGFTQPILADDMGIVAGHGRLEAATALYHAGKQISFPNGSPIPIGLVPVIDCSGWSADARKAYILADNQIAMNSGWDEDLLRLEVQDLNADEFDLSLLGFSDETLEELLRVEVDMGSEGEGDPDDAPELPEYPATMEGDTWVCGPHRVRCGSSTSLDDWRELMQGEVADICWTDPPYNVDVDRKNKLMQAATEGTSNAGKRNETGKIKNDKMGALEFRTFLADFYKALYAQLKPGAPVYIAHSDKEAVSFASAFMETGFKKQSILIWKKNNISLGMSDYQPIHEPIIYGYKPGSRHKWYGGRKNTSVIDMSDGSPFQKMEDGRYQIKVGDSVLVVSADAMVEQHPSTVLFESKPAKCDLHPTQKPVALVERMLTQSARAGDIVLDGFGGSGTTLIAADRLGMCARLMEIDPGYTDVIVRRWEALTGRRAVHAITGEVFPEAGEVRGGDIAVERDEDIF